MGHLQRAIAFVFMSAVCLSTTALRAEGEGEHAAVSYCRDYPNQIHLSDDGSILCFDSPLDREQKLDYLDGLHEGGRFVIRSMGGWTNTAIPLSEILMDRNVEVVIYDYCLSGCANYIFFASGRTYVTKDALVAWHGGLRPEQCDAEKLWIFSDKPQLDKAGQEKQDYGCEQRRALEQFVKRRNMKMDYTSWPQSPYIRRIIRWRYQEMGGIIRNLFWMWNPRYHDPNMMTRITYESYPKGQDEVDDMLSKKHLSIKVVYDP